MKLQIDRNGTMMFDCQLSVMSGPDFPSLAILYVELREWCPKANLKIARVNRGYMFLSSIECALIDESLIDESKC